MPERRTDQKEMLAYVYRTTDQGKTFEKLGGVDVPERAYDEHMVIELADDRLMMLVRTMYGIGVSYSYDRGMTWSPGKDSGLGGPNARLHIRRLKSGRILLVNHYEYQGRNNLTALLSEDECKTWKYKLLLDGRDNVSYPDATEDEMGNIYITYDRERACGYRSLEASYQCAREILYAKIREEDIIAGKLVCPESKLKCVISKLGEYKGEPLPFKDKKRYKEMVPYFVKGTKEEIIDRFFRYYYREVKPSMTAEEHRCLDELLDQLDTVKDKEALVLDIVRLFFNAERNDKMQVDEEVRKIIMDHLDEELTADEMAKMLGVSKYYLYYRFKHITNITIEEYQKTLKAIHK